METGSRNYEYMGGRFSKTAFFLPCCEKLSHIDVTTANSKGSAALLYRFWWWTVAPMTSSVCQWRACGKGGVVIKFWHHIQVTHKDECSHSRQGSLWSAAWTKGAGKGALWWHPSLLGKQLGGISWKQDIHVMIPGHTQSINGWILNIVSILIFSLLHLAVRIGVVPTSGHHQNVTAMPTWVNCLSLQSDSKMEIHFNRG